MKFAADRPYANPEKAARKILEIANSVEVAQDDRIYIDLINGLFLFREKGTPAHCSSSESMPLVIDSDSTFAVVIRDPAAIKKPC